MKKYVLAGAGNRGYWMYAKAIRDEYADCAVLAGIMDVNKMRAEYVKRQMGAGHSCVYGFCQNAPGG